MILEVLKSDERISLETLSTLTGLTPRSIQEQIHRERLQGAPICASNEVGNAGYYLGSAADCERQCASLGARIAELQAVRRKLQSTARKLRREGG